MAQYNSGLISVTNGSAIVTGTGTAFLANVSAGSAFTVVSSGIIYDVASVDSDTQITLSAPYQGVTGSDLSYTIHTGFTSPDQFPLLKQGDIETATIISRAINKIQQRFNLTGDASAILAAGIYPNIAAGLSATVDGDYFFVVSGSEFILYLNSSGSEVEQLRFASLSVVQQLATELTTAVDSAETFASNADTSADNAATSETNASASAAAASTSATNASSSATSAAASATAAATSETNAATSEANALDYSVSANFSADIAMSNANFRGRWVDLTGSLVVPASVSHDGSFWQLLETIADVTLDEPGVTANWQEIPLNTSYVVFDGNGNATFIGDITADDATFNTLTVNATDVTDTVVSLDGVSANVVPKKAVAGYVDSALSFTGNDASFIGTITATGIDTGQGVVECYAMDQAVRTTDSVTFAQLNADNIRIDDNTISSTNTNGDITIDPNGTGIVSIPSAVTITGTATFADATLDTHGITRGQLLNFIGTDDDQIPLNQYLGSMAYQDADAATVGQINIDNIQIDGNTISSTNTNGNITIDPNGTGTVELGANTNVTGTVAAVSYTSSASLNNFRANATSGSGYAAFGNALSTGGMGVNASNGTNTNTFIDFNAPDISVSGGSAFYRFGRGTTEGAASKLQFFAHDNSATVQVELNSSGQVIATADSIFNGVRVGLGGGSISSNTRVGGSALSANTSGINNVAIGLNSLTANTTGGNNTVVGQQAGLSSLTASHNTYIGRNACALNVSGFNVGLGSQAGQLTSSGGNVTSAGNSVFIGFDARPDDNTQTNQIVIGYEARGNGSNTVTIGNSSIVSNHFTGRLLTSESIKPGTYTVATQPSAATHGAGATLYFSDGAAGSPVLAFSDGTNWLRCDTRATISDT